MRNRGINDREIGVLKELCKGATNKEIAGRLLISENTVRAHLRSLMMKTDTDTRTALVVKAMTQKLVQVQVVNEWLLE